MRQAYTVGDLSLCYIGNSEAMAGNVIWDFDQKLNQNIGGYDHD